MQRLATLPLVALLFAAACSDDSGSDSVRAGTAKALTAVAQDSCATGEFEPDWGKIGQDKSLYGGWVLSNLVDRLSNNQFGPLVCGDPAGTVNDLLDVLTASGDFPKPSEITNP